jgi:hypothetical protein
MMKSHIARKCSAGLSILLGLTSIARSVPNPPASQQDRIGIYNWNVDTTSWPGSPDKLNWGANLVSGLGSHTIRVEISPRDDYGGVNGSATTLTAIAQRPAYRTLFSNPNFTTFLLTAYTQSDLNSNWSNGFTSSEQNAERKEIAALGNYLLSTYSNKNFIILQWEGDNAMSSLRTNTTAWNGYTAWIQSRVNGVTDARAQRPSSASKIYSGLEYSAVYSLDAGSPPCDTSAHKCVVSVVAPNVAVDYYSYSCWQSLGVDTADSQINSRLSVDLTTAYNWIHPVRTAITTANFIVGEFGSARDIPGWGDCHAAVRVREAITALETWGASYGLFWQIIDNPPTSGVYTGFGAYKYDGTQSLSGQTLANLYSTGTPTVPPITNCPMINPGGIVNATTFTSSIRAGDVISIFGSSFSNTGNVVQIHDGGVLATVTAGSPWWYESAGQINATLPASVVPNSNVRIYVTDGRGVDSDGQLITVSP